MHDDRLRPTPFYHFYSCVASLAAPIIWRRIRKKLSSEGIPPERQRERLGHATLPRPEGPLWWFHAASVGESVSVLALVSELLERHPQAHALITSGTAASAKVLAARLPERALHQFAPVDARGPLKRFFKHWRPDAGVFIESELWPQMLAMACKRRIPLALLNARLSKSSLRNWTRFDDTFRFLMGTFAIVRTQDRATLDGMLKLGVDETRVAQGPNLKSMILPPPVDDGALAELQACYTGPFWTAVSTHEGEEEAVLDAHRLAAEQLPGLRLILVPRHPTRASEIVELIRKAGLDFSQRSAGKMPGSAEVYLADTLGEVGLWYALAPVAFLGGSIGPAGGHTPYEPALFGTPVLHGPKVANFAETYAQFDSAGAAAEVADAPALANAVVHLLTDQSARSAMSQAALDLGEGQRHQLTDIAAELEEALQLHLSTPRSSV